MAHPTDRCRICGNPNLVSILDLGQQYLTGVFPKSREAKLTRGPLELVKCHPDDDANSSQPCCGLVQLRHAYDLGEMYGENYGYRSGLNRSMVEHLRSKVQHLLKIVSVGHDDLVIDIGSNDGTTLSFYPKGPTLAGIDPTAAKFRRYYREDAHVIPGFFSTSAVRRHFPGREAKIITSIAMFYDLEQPMSFMREIAEVLADDGIWHFEQSYLPLMLDTNAYDTVCHEHLEFYALKQIKWMADRTGLKIIDVVVNDVNGGSFAITAAKASSLLTGNPSAVAAILRGEEQRAIETLAPYERFRASIVEQKTKVVELLTRLKSQGKKVLGYGASTKGNVLLQYCDITPDLLPYIAEVNEDKFGAFTPGTWIPIISEKDAHAMKPDYFFVLPWHFKKNLLEREKAFLASGGKMIFPLPHLEIVPTQ